jgi:hypothetical protein
MPEATKPLAAANLRLGVTIEQALFQGGWFARVGGGVEREEEEGWKGRRRRGGRGDGRGYVTSCGLRQRLPATPEQGRQ